jgi:opacity protein-like surface antigen
MTKRTPGTIVFILLALAGYACAQDTILLNNGDILTGTVLQQNADSVYFKSSAFGSVSLQTKDIREIRFETGELGEVVIPADAITVDPIPPAAMDPSRFVGPLPAPSGPHDTAKESNWTGQAGLSIAMRESTQSDMDGVTGADEFETYRVYGNVDWKSEQNRLRWDWTYRYTRDEIRTQDDYLNLTQQYSHDFSKSYFTTAKTMYQRDYRRQIENEFLQTAELGIKWFDADAFKFSTSAGGGYHAYERNTQNGTTLDDETLSIEEPKFIFDQSLRWQVTDPLALIQKYTHLGDLTNYHFVFMAGLENKLIRDIFLRLEYRLDRDTEVFYNDRGYYDKALLTSLLYKF